ncbi:hypothetical protein ACTA71_010237 [Dictyostelium dimigraforme]
MERPKKVKSNGIRFSLESSSGEGSTIDENINNNNNSNENGNDENNESDCTINNNENNSKNSPTFDALYKSIPNDILERIKDCKVKYAFITRGTTSISKISTSKQKIFKTPVSLEFAIQFLAESSVNDSTLVFTNEDSLIFAGGVFLDLEVFDESD